ncbi:MAG: DUF4331 domain-containing protein [Chloroflexota bacterium]|nr:DUF4331 domain-containing protein [Chloroflexota bacterium]
MSDHGDHAVAERDITDLYAFQNPGDPSKTILIMNVNPGAPALANAFDATAVYEFKVDTNADTMAELAFQVTFSPLGSDMGGDLQSSGQTATVRLATGATAAGTDQGAQALIVDAPVSFGAEPRVTDTGDFAFFAGLRSDPFFVDAEGFFNGLQWTGKDSTATQNVFGIVLELPNRVFGDQPRVGVWARVLIPHDDGLLQADRAGRPFTNGVMNLNDEEGKNVFNQTEPARDAVEFLHKYAAVFQQFGHYSSEEAISIAGKFLPDILPYDYSKESGYPNGRTLTDDVAVATWALLTNGTATDDGIGPHTDLLPHFPYLGHPHETSVTP